MKEIVGSNANKWIEYLIFIFGSYRGGSAFTSYTFLSSPLPSSSLFPSSFIFSLYLFLHFLFLYLHLLSTSTFIFSSSTSRTFPFSSFTSFTYSICFFLLLLLLLLFSILIPYRNKCTIMIFL